MTDAKRLRRIRRRGYRGDRLGVTDTPVRSLSTHSGIAHLTLDYRPIENTYSLPRTGRESQSVKANVKPMTSMADAVRGDGAVIRLIKVEILPIARGL